MHLVQGPTIRLDTLCHEIGRGGRTRGGREEGERGKGRKRGGREEEQRGAEEERGKRKEGTRRRGREEEKGEGEEEKRRKRGGRKEERLGHLAIGDRSDQCHWIGLDVRFTISKLCSSSVTCL